jgi:hypothetical protein
MRLAIVLTGWLFVGATLTTSAQDVMPADVAPLFDAGTTEWMITGGPALGVTVFHSQEGHNYFLQAVSWGRVLSGLVGPGALRGRFQWSVEFVPLYGQYDPERTYGFGITPLLWRWNFAPRGKIAPFAELAGGALWTRDPVPADTTTANFTAHASYGIRYFVRPRTAFVAAYRFHHISNGNRLDRNPGVNAHVIQLGVSLVRPR